MVILYLQETYYGTHIQVFELTAKRVSGIETFYIRFKSTGDYCCSSRNEE